MKKQLLSGLLLASSLILVACGQGTTSVSTASSTSTAETTVTSAAETTATDVTTAAESTASQSQAGIDEAMAKQAALADAGLTEADVINLTIEAHFTDSLPHYDIEFVHGTTEYSYAIDANTANILEVSQEAVGE